MNGIGSFSRGSLASGTLIESSNAPEPRELLPSPPLVISRVDFPETPFLSGGRDHSNALGQRLANGHRVQTLLGKLIRPKTKSVSCGFFKRRKQTSDVETRVVFLFLTL